MSEKVLVITVEAEFECEKRLVYELTPKGIKQLIEHIRAELTENVLNNSLGADLKVGETLTLEIEEMTRAELDNLPEGEC